MPLSIIQISNTRSTFCCADSSRDCIDGLSAPQPTIPATQEHHFYGCTYFLHDTEESVQRLACDMELEMQQSLKTLTAEILTNIIYVDFLLCVQKTVGEQDIPPTWDGLGRLVMKRER